MDVNQLQTVRRVLGYAAMGTMISPDVAKSALDVVDEVRESVDSPEQIQSLVKAVGVLDRGLMPSQDLCRNGQREVYVLIDRMQERGVQINVPRAR